MSEINSPEPIQFRTTPREVPAVAPPPPPAAPLAPVGALPASISLDARVREFEASLITWALDATHGNKSKAAALLQIKRSTLGDRIVRCGLADPPEQPAPAERVG